MARVMLIGSGPLPRPSTAWVGEGVLRTRQFLKLLQSAGHTINLFTLPAGQPRSPEADMASMLPDNLDGFSYQRFTNRDQDFIDRALAEQQRNLQPDAVIGVGDLPAWYAAQLPGSFPLWIDFAQPPLGLAQGLAHLSNSDAPLLETWSRLRQVLRRLDKYSAVSLPLLYAVIGELGSLGRLNSFTQGYLFGHHLPDAAPHFVAGTRESRPLLRGPIVPGDAFLILWYATLDGRADLLTAFTALNRLMERYPAVHCVVACGAEEGAPREHWAAFEELLEQSPHKERYHLFGWPPLEQLPGLCREADLGLVADAPNYQTLLGSHPRLTLLAGEELALAGTVGTEITEWLDAGRAFLGAPPGQPAALADAIEPWIEQREELARYGANAKKLVETDCDPQHTGARLLDWLREPRLAPDNQAKLQLDGGQVQDLIAATINPLEEQQALLGRLRPGDLRQAVADWESRQTRPRNLFGFGSRRP